MIIKCIQLLAKNLKLCSISGPLLKNIAVHENVVKGVKGIEKERVKRDRDRKMEARGSAWSRGGGNIKLATGFRERKNRMP